MVESKAAVAHNTWETAERLNNDLEYSSREQLVDHLISFHSNYKKNVKQMALGNNYFCKFTLHGNIVLTFAKG